MEKRHKITLENFSGKRIDGIVTNQPVEMTDAYIEVVAEAIMQVLYNLGMNSKVELSYDLKIDGGTKYMVYGTDVMVIPTFQDSYNRRIRNNKDVVAPDKK